MTNDKVYFNLKFRLILLLALLLMFYIIFSNITFASYKSNSIGNKNIQVASFNYKIESDKMNDLNINLEDTILPNNYSNDKVIPGTNGLINLKLNFNDTDVGVKYKIMFNLDKLPNNLKLYKDSNYKEELNYIEDEVNLDKLNTKQEINIYWKWLFTDDDESLYQNKDIELIISTIVSQNI